MDSVHPHGNTKFTHHKTDTDTLTAGETPSAKNYAAFARGCRDGAGGLPRVRISRRNSAPAFRSTGRGPLAVASFALTACGSRGESAPRRRQHRRRHQDRQDRRHRAAVRRPVRARPGHPALGRAGRQAGQRHERHPGLEARGRRRGRRGQGRRRQERRHQARRRQRRHRRRRHAQLQRRQQIQPVFAPANIVQVSPANTNPSLTKGADAGRPEAGRTRRTSAPAPPTRSRARSPRSTCYDAGDQEGRHDPRQEDLRPGPGRHLHRRSSRSGGGTVVAAETINPDDSNYQAVVSKVKPSKPAGRLLRRRVPAGRSALAADEGRRPQRPARWAATASTTRSTSSSAGTTSDGDLATSVGAPVDSAAVGQEVRRRLQGGRLQGARTRPTAATPTTPPTPSSTALKTSLASDATTSKSARAGDGRCGRQGLVRRRHRQGRLRRVRRHHDQGADRLQGRPAASGPRSRPRPSTQ